MRSMTGYAQLEEISGRIALEITAKATNHRYLDLNVYYEDNCAFLEPDIRSLVQKKIGRGKIDLGVKLSFTAGEVWDVTVQKDVIRGLHRELEDLKEETGLKGNIALSDLMLIPEVVKIEPVDPELADDERDFILGCIDCILDNLVEMKEREGAYLKEDFDVRLGGIKKRVEELENVSESMTVLYTGKLSERIGHLLGQADLELDKDRIMEEAAFYADRSDISEELVRINSHLSQAAALIEDGGTSTKGKRLDFIFQEMQREVNTVGAKARFVNICDQVIELKSELERLREQVRNIE